MMKVDQFSEITGLIQIMEKYLLEGKMRCDQLPIDDILAFVSEEYNAVNLEGDIAIATYRELLTNAVIINDTKLVSRILKILLIEHRIFDELYDNKIKKYNLDNGLVPYKVELQYYRNLERNKAGAKNDNFRRSEVFKGKGVVFSAITGQYDSMRAPEFVDENLDYVLFTDSKTIETNVWRVVYLDNPEGLDPTRLARKIKIIGGYEYLTEYDYTIWTDGKLQITGDISDYIKKYSIEAPILCFNHYANDDIYEEAEACLMFNRDNANLIKNQVDRYKAEGYPEHSGLIDSCMLIRNNKDEALKKAMYDWWSEVKTGSKRDQLSFNYACWKNNISYDSSPLISYDNQYIRTYGHT